MKIVLPQVLAVLKKDSVRFPFDSRHSKRSSTWRYGKKYHYLPKVTLDFVAFVMSKKYTEFTSALAAKELKDHLNDAREAAKDKDKASFRTLSVPFLCNVSCNDCLIGRMVMHRNNFSTSMYDS